MTGVEIIAAAFARSDKRAALMPYLMGGFPDIEKSLAIGHAYADGGADLIELGIPYSDPLADGPVIQAAGAQALRAGSTVASVLEVAQELAGRLPVVVMCYANLVLSRGQDQFASALAQAGVSGLIVPDLPIEEAPTLLAACDNRGVALVPLVAPTTPDQRMAKIGSRARGFLYTVAVTGTTGERSQQPTDLAAVVKRARRHTDVPVAVGFGISTPQDADSAAQAGAQGVIVGTRLVRAAAESKDPAEAVRALVSDFAGALR